MTEQAALWPSPWPAEDAGPQRRQAPLAVDGVPVSTGFELGDGAVLHAHSRLAMVSTMVVLREPGEVYLLCHTGGDDAVSWVEQIDPETLETRRRSPDLPGGPTWPGGLAAHADGSLYVVFGAHAHRLSPDLEVLASRALPRRRPYNSFVVLPDGCLALKDFAGARPGSDGTGPSDGLDGSELLVLRPGSLEPAATLSLPEGSVARLSADGNTIYVVGDTTLWRVHWDGTTLELDPDFAPRYRTLPGQTYGWDAVIDAGAAWFLDDGAGSERFAGTFVGVGANECPLHLVRVDLESAEVTFAEVCGLPGGLVANPPAVDPERRIVVGYDSSNAVVTAWSFDDPFTGFTQQWQRPMAHAAHPMRFPAGGQLVLNDHDASRGTDQLVVLDIETGVELGRVDTGSPLQSVVFDAAGWSNDVYLCSFTTVTRVWAA